MTRDVRSVFKIAKSAEATALGLFLILLVSLAGSLAGQTSANSASSEKADRIEIHKADRTMTLLRDGQILKTYKVALSTVPVGGKEREGDHKVPEGSYIVDRKNAQSIFHLALHVSYPNKADMERARKLGVKPGGDIEIHGLGRKFGWVGSAHREVDWTDGCVAVTNEEIEEIWPMVRVGTPVEIRP